MLAKHLMCVSQKASEAETVDVFFLLKLYLTHLAMKGDSSDAKVPQQQRHPLGIVTRAAEDDK